MATNLEIQNAYARALLEAASSVGRLDAVYDSAHELAEYLEQVDDRRLRVFIESPQTPTGEKRRLVHDMFADRVDPMLVNLIYLMIDRRRSRQVAPALRRFCVLVDERRGIHPGLVDTARALDEAERRRLTERLEAFMGGRLRLRFRVDPRLIGGVVFRTRDLLVDRSLRRGLNDLRDRMKGLRLTLPTPEMGEG